MTNRTVEIHTRNDYVNLPAGPAFLLVHDQWNDWWEFQTQFALTYFDSDSTRHNIGLVKIATEEMTDSKPDLDCIIKTKPNGLFSVGQDAEYYEMLNQIDRSHAEQLLAWLGDIAFDSNLLTHVLEFPVTRRSLLRSVNLESVRDQFARIAKGGARLTKYNIRVERPQSNHYGALSLDFEVVPASTPPTNIHVLVGRNGAGKSTLLTYIHDSFSAQHEKDLRLTSLVAVSFSAFDSFGQPGSGEITDDFPIRYIGLKKEFDPKTPGSLKSNEDLAQELADSLRECWGQPKRRRLIRALEVLENDPIFSESEFSNLLKSDETKVDDFAALYHRLSSGHKIVLVTLVRLVETVEEKSLVLIDEPEAHLHPPLLSAFIRALSDLLIDRNGLAIIATHSPVVLQEVPAACVWKISRSGIVSSASRPEIETFGENVGTLTHEIFGLEVRGTGFHRLLAELALSGDGYDEILVKLQNQLGLEGRAILRALSTIHDTHLDA